MKEKNKISIYMEASIKKHILTFGLLITFTLPIFAGGSSQFHLDWKTDLILLGAGGGAIATGMVLKDFAEEPKGLPEGWAAWPSFPYNEGLADGSNYLLVTGMAGLPFLMSRWTGEDAATLGIMYIEAMSISWGVKESLKAVFSKYRPFTTDSDPPADLMDEEDRYFSFPSGHTTVAFTTAGFATTIFTASDAPGWIKGIFTGVNFSIAAGVAALRVISGKHYLVDVFTGALIGTASGILIPVLHSIKQDRNFTFGISPSMATVGFSY